MKMKISCTSGVSLPLAEIKLYNSTLKKHSFVEIERMCASIENDGFLFPIAIGKVGGVNYVVDGECRYKALREMEMRGWEIGNVPVFYVRCGKDTFVRNVVIGTSVNHVVTRYGLEQFCEDKKLLKELAFCDGELIDFNTVNDIEMFFRKTDNMVKGITQEGYAEQVRGGLL